MNRTSLPTVALAITLIAFPALGWSQQQMQQTAAPPGKPAPPKPEPLVREIFVPYEDLNIILEGDSSRVFLPRDEYEALLAKAKTKPELKTPLAAAVLSAEYDGVVDDGRALITGKLTVEVLRDDLHALPLPFSGVGLRSATVAGKPASLGRDARGRVLLFIEGVGKHELLVQFTAAVPAAAALQTLQMALPTPPASRLRLSVGGNVEVKAGAALASRNYDEKSNRTALELLPQNGVMSLVLSLNNRQAREQRLITADAVLIDEITLGYERLHAQIKFRILHDPVDRFRFVVPADFEITSAVSPLLSRWEVKDEGGKRILETFLTEPTTDPVELKIVANRSPLAGQNWLDAVKSWKCPRLQPLDVAGERAVVGLVIENRLEQRNLQVNGLLPIDSIVLGDAFLSGVLQSEGGGPALRQLGAFFAPAYVNEASYGLTASYVRPPASVDVLGRHILTLGDSELALVSKLTLAPLAEDLFQVRLKIPASWQAAEIIGPSGEQLLPERYALPDGGLGLIISLPQPIIAGGSGLLQLKAVATPAGWLADWKEQKLAFPQVAVSFPHIEKDPAAKAATSGRQSGAIFVRAVDDLALEPETLTGLTPLLAEERGGDGAGAAAAYRYETADYAAMLVSRRKTPSLAAEVFSFLRIGAGNLSVHYELNYLVREARTRQLSFSLPLEDTPEDLTITGLGEVSVKEHNSKVEGDRRRWTVQLAERAQGELRLAVSFDRRRDPKQMKNWLLPLIRAENVEHQSAFVSLEGAAELEIETVVAPRKVDEGELYKRSQFLESEQLNAGDRRLIGAYGYLGDSAQLQVTVIRRAPHELPAALVQTAQLYSRVSASGLMQSAAIYEITTKASSLEIELPPAARLWTVLVDGASTKPQRDGDKLLVSLPSGAELFHRVQLVYEQDGRPLGLSGRVSASAPKLLLRSGAEGERDTPQADLVWNLVLPAGFVVKQSGGTVEWQNPPRRIPAALIAGGALYELLGGVGKGQFLPAVQAARESARYRYDAPSAAKTEYYFDSAATPAPASPAPANAEFGYAVPPTSEPAPPPVAMTPAPPAAPAPAAEAAASDPFAAPKPAEPSAPQKNDSLRPGDTVDSIRLRESERRPKSSDLFELKDETKSMAPPNGPRIIVQEEEKVKLKQEMDIDRVEGLAQRTGQAAQAQSWDETAGPGSIQQFDSKLSLQTAALEGVSTLPIDLLPSSGDTVTQFRSLGVDPQLDASVVDHTRLSPGAVGMGLLVFVCGSALTLHEASRKASFVFLALLASSLPLLLTTWFDGVADLLDGCFLGACALIPYYLLAALVLGCCKWLRQCCFADCCGEDTSSSISQITPPPATTATLLLVLLGLSLLANSASAQPDSKPMPPMPPAESEEPAATTAPLPPIAPPVAMGLPPAISVPEIKDLLPLLDQGGPVKVPADAIIVPYDAGKEGPLTPGDKILIPYAKYVELWNRANPDQRLQVKPPPADYAVASGSYEALLGAADDLEVSGVLTIDVLTDKPVAIPLPLAGGVITRAVLDGKPARLQIVGPQPDAPNSKPQQTPAQQMAQPAIPGLAPATTVMVLHTQGKGRKSFDFTLKLAMERRGGWRIVNAVAPPAAATALLLNVPDEQTEVRLTGAPDRDAFETKAKGEKIETALDASGRLAVEWRPKVAVGQVDQGLTVQSLGLLDVREDGLRLVWKVDLSFGRGVRDRFTLAVPAGYQLEAVTGGNIRGWQVKPDAGRQLLEVTLLKQAQGKESLTLQLALRGRPGLDPALTNFAAPAVSVVGAALQQGQIVVRRSPRVELQSGEIIGLSRAEADPRFGELLQLAEKSEASLLALTNFQTYRFTLSGAQQNFTLGLLAKESASSATADVKGVLRLAAEQSLFEAVVTIKPQGQPLYFIDLELPAGFELDRLQPSDVEWSLGDANPAGRRKLSVQLLRGYDQPFALKLAGRLPKSADPKERPAPTLGVLNVTRTDTLLAVLADPDTDVAAVDLKNCDIALLDQAFGWLKPAQRSYLRTLLRCTGSDYAAKLKLSYRQPRISVETITNIKVTSQSINETVQLFYRIEEAGIHELTFQIPEHLRTARIKIGNEPSLLQRLKLEPATTAGGQQIAGMLKATLTLQEDVNRELGVIVEHDRLLSDRPQTVVLPLPLTGTITRRFVVLENAGRDELLVDKTFGLEPLSRQQQAWQDLMASLGGVEQAGAQAYVTTGGEATPSLTFQTKARTAVQTAGARIEFASTTLVVDSSGAYRAVQNFQMNNSTEQFLDVQLPAGARLWTTLVKGTPVKPVQPPSAQPGQVRIPLIKNPAGSGDYSVEIKYGGQMPAIVTGRKVIFPLVKTSNINVEMSQLRLLLPENHHWYGFGGTMERAASEEELEQGFQSYLGKKIQETKSLLSSNDINTQLRAQSNLEGIKQLWSINQGNRASNSLKQLEQSFFNEKALAEVEQEAQERLSEQLEEAVVQDNRFRLNGAWSKRQLERSKNVVGNLGENFDFDSDAAQNKADAPQSKANENFNPNYLQQNKLSGQPQGEAKPATGKLPAGQPRGPEKPGSGRGEEGETQLESRVTRGGRGVSQLEELKKMQKEVEQNLPQQQSGEKKGEVQEQQLLQKMNRLLDAPDQAPAKNEPQLDDNLRERDQLRKYQSRLQGEQARQSLELSNSSGLFQGQSQGQVQPNAPGDSGGGGQSAFGAIPLPQQAPARQGIVNGPFGGGLGAPADPQSGAVPETRLARDYVVPGVVAYGNQPGMGGGSGGGQGGLGGLGGGGDRLGLASLDVQLPQRGALYLFTTPRGEIEVTAQPVSQDLLVRGFSTFVLLVSLALLYLLWRIVNLAAVQAAVQSQAVAFLSIFMSLVMVCSDVLPVLGLILLAVGLTRSAWFLYRRYRPATNPAVTAA